MHFRGGAHRTTPFVWGIDGTHGSLRITADRGLPMSTTLTVEGAREGERWAALMMPAGYNRFRRWPAPRPTTSPTSAPRSRKPGAGRPSHAPTFDYGVDLHRTLEAVVTSVEQ